MYLPTAFMPSEPQGEEFLAGVVAGDLVTATDGGMAATFLPVLLDRTLGESGSFLGHLSRGNPQWQVPAHGESMLIARGPDAYVSPSWYASKAEHGRVVPTWNYVTANIHGELVVHDDPEWVSSLVRRLTERHENSRAAPWSVDDAPAPFFEGQLRAIVGVELRITRVEVKVKMSQNRPADDVQGVIDGLRADGSEAIAGEVERARSFRDG